MNWLNLRTEIFRNPATSAVSNEELGVWLRVMAFCCEQENGGKISGAADWNTRQWMTSCGVTKEEVENCNALLTVKNKSIEVFMYPVDKEHEVKTKREAGKRGGEAKARNFYSTARPDATSSASSTATSSATPDATQDASSIPIGNATSSASTERNGKEWKGIEKELEEKGEIERVSIPYTENPDRVCSNLQETEKEKEEVTEKSATAPDLATFCEYFSTRIACLGFPVAVDDWLMETHGYYASQVWPQKPPQNWKAMEGKLIANYRNRHAQLKMSTMPMRNGKPQRPINDF
jgi:hypothetical protein